MRGMPEANGGRCGRSGRKNSGRLQQVEPLLAGEPRYEKGELCQEKQPKEAHQ